MHVMTGTEKDLILILVISGIKRNVNKRIILAAVSHIRAWIAQQALNWIGQ